MGYPMISDVFRWGPKHGGVLQRRQWCRMMFFSRRTCRIFPFAHPSSLMTRRKNHALAELGPPREQQINHFFEREMDHGPPD